ncbi:S-layer homology domain-containing protein [Paenibacillus chibensis]|uniref:S-layer homology domain-containing protein n=1 Tax=Paenibacillus chibensis TaxID=59846 RepID=A0ABU6PXH5_9BACL|nr:S-layer homology domain-containing protein [Paenibacillus chibensis]
MKRYHKRLAVIVMICMLQTSVLCNLSWMSYADAASTGLTLTASSGSPAFTAGDNVTSTPVAIDPGMTVSDPDHTTLESATVAITGNFHAAEDVLAFTNTSAVTYGNIVASYNSAIGDLTLSSSGATATLAQWQAALRSVTYNSTAVTPNTADRAISFTVSVGTVTSSAATRTITIIAVDQTPMVTTSGGSTAFKVTGNMTATPVAIDSGLTVSDLDHSTLASASVAITGNFHSAEDVLAFTNTSGVTYGNIVASYSPGTGVLTLTSSGATATLAQWQAALRSVTYSSSAVTPNTATRTISFIVNDGIKTSAVATKLVTVTVTNQAPVVTTTAGTTLITDHAPHDIDNGITVLDPDSRTLQSATVAITGHFQNGDMLNINDNASTLGTGFTVSYNATSGTLTVTATNGFTAEQLQNVLRAVQYSSSLANPDTSQRTITFTVNDGQTESAPATKQIVFAQPPKMTASSGSTSFTAGDNAASIPVAVDPRLQVEASDSMNLLNATVSISDHFQSSEDVLSFINDGSMGSISGSYDASQGILTLSSNGEPPTWAEWQAALQAVTYTSTAITPNTSDRTITFKIEDQWHRTATATKTVSVSATNQTPVIQASGHTASYVSPAPPVVIDPGLTVSDRDHLLLPSATVSITDHYHSAEDVLAFTNDGTAMGDISAQFDAAQGVMSLTSAAGATLAEWESALRAVTYVSTAAIPTKETRTVEFVVSDGKASSAPAISHISVSQSIVLTGLEASPNKVTLQEGNTRSSVITATYSDLSTLDVTPSVTWSVAAPSIAGVKDGIISGIAAGTTVVTAAYGGKTATIEVVVTSAGNSHSHNGNDSSGGSSTPGAGTTAPTIPTPKPDEPKQPATELNDFLSPVVNREKWIAALKQALATHPEPLFKDMSAHWASRDISLASRLGWIEGYQDGTFKPNQQVTRAEFSALMVNIFGLNMGDKTVQLTDINDQWATSYIQILASQGFIQGYADGTFQPKRTISRAEMLVILSKLIDFQTQKPMLTTSGFSDIPSGYWAQSVIDSAFSAKIIQGIGDHRFAPNTGITRAEAVTLILRALRLDPEIKSLLE